MDIDPLADRAPPRHAIESDSEDEPDGGLNAPRDTEQRNKEEELATTIVWTTGAPKSVPLQLIVTLEPVHAAFEGAVQFNGWDPIATVKLGDGEIAHIVLRKDVAWLQIQEPHKIGMYSSRKFAQTILEHFSSERIVILDTYSLPSYISTIPLTESQKSLEPPIRYLTTYDQIPSGVNFNDDLDLFAPPNLLTSPTASFLSLVARRHSEKQQLDMTALLLPALHTHSLEQDWNKGTLLRVLDYASRLLGSGLGLVTPREIQDSFGLKSQSDSAGDTDPQRGMGKLSEGTGVKKGSNRRYSGNGMYI